MAKDEAKSKDVQQFGGTGLEERVKELEKKAPPSEPAS